MRNFHGSGDQPTFVAPSGGVTGGVGYVLGATFVVAAASAAVGESFAGRRVGVVRLPKATGAAITQGQQVWWDDSAKQVRNATATGRFPIGTANLAAASADTEVLVILSGMPTVAAA